MFLLFYFILPYENKYGNNKKKKKQVKNNYIEEEENNNGKHCIEDCIYKTNQDNNSKSHIKWIGCHNKECEVEWYHVECLGIEETPKGNWYCPLCKDKKKSKKR